MAELEAIDRAIEQAPRDGGRLLVVEGPSGIGKSLLLATLEERAAERGFFVLTGRGNEFEVDFSFGVALQLFEPHLARAGAEERHRLFAGAAAPGTAPVSAPRRRRAGARPPPAA